MTVFANSNGVMRCSACSMVLCLLALSLDVPSAAAAPTAITLVYEHHIFSLSPGRHPEWRRPKRHWFFQGRPAKPSASMQTCSKGSSIPTGWTTSLEVSWNEEAIAKTIEEEIGKKLNRETGTVAIRRVGTGEIVFDGFGLPGRTVNAPLAAKLVRTALETNTPVVKLPITTKAPMITVEDSELRDLGIREVVMVGESVFTKSPVNRRHNIGVGIRKMNGHLIPQGRVFSFVETLGHVGPTTGYRKELVIQGDETLPDYGGGLCQVSSTAYRGPWEYGLPILQRKNHSYAVSYYSPQGTDATIYPPRVDMKFLNDTPGALLIQAFTDASDRAYFIYYGTKDDRKTEVFGPFITDRRSAPTEERISYTTEIPPGEKRKASERHDGMKAAWYRTIAKAGTGVAVERFFSAYETRPLYWQIGVTPEEMARLTGVDESESPSWLPSND